MRKMTNDQLSKSDQKYYLQAFKRYPIALKHGKGCTVWDVEGNEYLDALAGIAVNNLGHAHPEIVRTIRDQAGELMHISNFYVSQPQVEFSEALCQATGMDRVFIANSGAEAVEGAIKLARKYAQKNERGTTTLFFEGAFHGRTLATIAMGKEKMQKGFDPIPAGFKEVPFNDIDAVRQAVSEDVGAIIIEPVQGEGGINPSNGRFLKELRELCDQNKIVLVFDEIQCGMGRTGTLFAKGHYDVEPDILTTAKGLGSGFPIGAFLAKENVASAIEYGDHGSTFGGNPLAAATALKTLELINQPAFLKEVTEKGRYLRGQIEAKGHPKIKEVRGLGLMLGVVCEMETKDLVLKMLQEGVLANSTAGNVLRLVPPLIISKKEIDRLVEVIFKVI